MQKLSSVKIVFKNKVFFDVDKKNNFKWSVLLLLHLMHIEYVEIRVKKINTV
jgi:hypothetical protein